MPERPTDSTLRPADDKRPKAAATRVRLTDEGIRRRKLPPKPEREKLWDTIVPGLILDVSYGGARTWKAIHYVNGSARLHMLGRWPVLNLAEARAKARTFLGDPDAALAKIDTGSFKDIAENWFKRYVEGEKKLRSAPEIRRILERYVYPRWQDRQINTLKRRDVADLLDAIEDDHGTRQADYVLAVIRKLFNWYATRDDDFINPIVRGMSRYDHKARARDRILTDDEIRALWNATAGETSTFGALVRFALLTAQRREKIVTMRWADINADSVWTIPAEDREKGNAETLTLPALARALVQARPRLAGNPHVFAAGKGDGPFNSFSERKADLDAALTAANGGTPWPHWTLHDLRRTARSLMSRAGVPREHAERLMGHAIPGVEGVYDHYDYAPEKAAALAKLATLIERILDPAKADNVVPIRAGSAAKTRSKRGRR